MLEKKKIYGYQQVHNIYRKTLKSFHQSSDVMMLSTQQ